MTILKAYFSNSVHDTFTFGGIVLALALAFGSGGRDIAKDFLEKKFKKSSEDNDTFKHI